MTLQTYTAREKMKEDQCSDKLITLPPIVVDVRVWSKLSYNACIEHGYKIFDLKIKYIYFF